jgi:plastocyanin
VTLTATVTPATPVPTGTVTFYNGATSLGTGTLNASGVATLAYTFSTAGTYSVTATYGGSSTYATSTSTELSVVVSSSQ